MHAGHGPVPPGSRIVNSEAPGSAPAPDPAQVEALLQQCWQVLADVFLPRVPAVFQEALSLAVRSGDEAQSKAGAALSLQERTLVAAYAQELRRSFDHAVAVFQGRKAATGERRATLSLMEMDESDLRSQIDQCAARLRNLVQSAHGGVSLRLQSLRGGADYNDTQSPLRPALFLGAAAEALEAARPPVEGVGAVLRHFPGPLAGPLEAAYEAIGRFLESRGVLPMAVTRAAVAVRPSAPAVEGSRLSLEGEAAPRAAADEPVRAAPPPRAAATARPPPARIEPAVPEAPPEEETLRAYARLQAALGINTAPLVDLVIESAYRPAGSAPAGVTAPAAELLAAMLSAQRQDAARVADKGTAATTPDKSGAAASKGAAEFIGTREHSRHLIGLAGTPLHKLTIQLVARLFARIERDRLVPAPLRTQIACLRFPFLEVALADPAVLARPDHPARRLINALASSAIGWSAEGPDNQRYLRHARSAVHFVVHSPGASASAFAQSCDQFEAFLAAVVPAASDNIVAARELLREAEKREIQSAEAARFLGDILEGAGLEDYLRQFVLGPWARVLVESAAAEGRDAGQFRRYLMVIPDLIASVLPPAANVDRKRQVETIAALLASLKDGVALIGWPPEKMQAFLNRLMIAHSHVLTGGEAPAPAAGAFSASTVRIRLDGFALRDAAEAEPDLAVPVVDEAVQNLLTRARSPVVHQWLKTPPELAADAIGSDEAGRDVDQWRDRSWFDIRVGRALVRMRLIGWTPARTLALFSSRTGGSLASLSHDSLVQYLRGRLIAPTETAPLLSRALRSVLKDLQRAVQAADGNVNGA